METKSCSTLAPTAAGSAAHFVVASRTLPSTWAVPVQGIRMPNPASQLGSIASTTAEYSATANAAKGATRKAAMGGEAFEDPL